MKRICLLSVFIFYFPVLAFTQTEQKKFLDMATTWVDANIQCKQFYRADIKGVELGKPIGKCQVTGKPIFCHLYSPNSTELILHVCGSGGFVVGGGIESDDKYIIFSLIDNNLKADVFFEHINLSVEPVDASLIEFPDGSELIKIPDGISYCGTSGAHLFGGLGGKMRKVLDYSYNELCAQTYKGYSTLLIPLKNGNLRLIKFSYDDGLQKIDFKDTYYHFDSIKKVYVSFQSERTIALGLGLLDWDMRLNQGVKNDIWEKGYLNKLNRDDLEEIILNLKNYKDDSRRKYALALLNQISGKDLGDNYDAWEKWKRDWIPEKPLDGEADQP
jgi:hypothetical protein